MNKGQALMHAPDFFIVGAPRCGTTAMNEYLKRHPEIFISNRKEIHFFDTDLHTVPPRTEAEYLKLFELATDQKWVGETSVWYLLSDVAASRIKAFNPESRIIIMLRNPVDMVYSLHGRMLFHDNEDVEDFQKAFAMSNQRWQGPGVSYRCELPAKCLAYQEVGRFGAQAQRYYDLFDPSRIHIVVYDDFRADTPGQYQKILQFLEVEPTVVTDFKTINPHVKVRSRFLQSLAERSAGLSKPAGPWRRKISKAIWKINRKPTTRPTLSVDLRRNIQEHFRNDIHRLSDLLNRDLARRWLND